VKRNIKLKGKGKGKGKGETRRKEVWLEIVDS
jgi:hypothetical protein